MSRWERIVAWLAQGLAFLDDTRLARWFARVFGKGGTLRRVLSPSHLVEAFMLSRPIQGILRRLFGAPKRAVRGGESGDEDASERTAPRQGAATPSRTAVPTRPDAEEFFAQIADDYAPGAPTRPDAAEFFREISADIPEAAPAPTREDSKAFFREISDAPGRAAAMRNSGTASAVLTEKPGGAEGVAEKEAVTEEPAPEESDAFQEAAYAPDDAEDVPDDAGTAAEKEAVTEEPAPEESDAFQEAAYAPDDAREEPVTEEPVPEESDAFQEAAYAPDDAEEEPVTEEPEPVTEETEPVPEEPEPVEPDQTEEDSLQIAMRLRWDEYESMARDDGFEKPAGRTYDIAGEDFDFDDDFEDEDDTGLPFPVRIFRKARAGLRSLRRQDADDYGDEDDYIDDAGSYDDDGDYTWDDDEEDGAEPVSPWRRVAEARKAPVVRKIAAEQAVISSEPEPSEKQEVIEKQEVSDEREISPEAVLHEEPPAPETAPAASADASGETETAPEDAEAFDGAETFNSEPGAEGGEFPETDAFPDADEFPEEEDGGEFEDAPVRRKRVTRLGGLLAAYQRRDPAARSKLEVLLLYPGVQAILWHRVAHWLYCHHRLFLARCISQWSRFWTGIEIHPGAKIGRRLVIDHGMGIIIGETTEIGDDCLIYQGVTLGGTGKEQGKRHPTLGNNVLVGSGAKILGPFTVGDNARIAAGAVVLRAVPPECTAVGVPAQIVRKAGKPVFYTDDVDQTSVGNPTLERIAALASRVEDLEKKLDMPTEPMHSVDEYDDYVI